MGFTITGVTITMSSVFVFVFEIDRKNLPRIGTSPINGIFERSAFRDCPAALQ